MFLQYNRNMKIAILGYGVEGKSVERYLKSSLRRRTSKWEIEIRDVKKQGKDYLKGLESFDMIVRSPGIPYLLPEIQKAKKAGVEITSTTKLFFKNANGVLVGITGTKGKGTTATLLYKILKASNLGLGNLSKRDVHLIGNMGIPMLDELPKLNKNSISILELSSFQLQDLDTSPHIAAVLDISPDHLNYHKNFKEYLEAKSKLVSSPLPRHQIFRDTDIFLLKNSSYSRRSRSQGLEKFMPSSMDKRSSWPQVFYFPDNKFSKQIAKKCRGTKIGVFPDKNLLRGDLKIAGYHNLKNASMAAAIGRAFGAKDGIINRTIRNFKGLPHRLEFVREINGVKYYNDSASTNPAATVAALNAFPGPKILIAGGAGKNLDYKPIGRALKNSNTKLVVLNGENKKEIGKAIGGAVGMASPIIYINDLKSAVKIACGKAKKGDVVILSPASTGFDQFSGYGERGVFFKTLIRKISG